MKYWALIKNTKVVNVIIADEDTIQSYASSFDNIVEISKEVGSPGIDWSYIDGQFIAPAPIEE